MVNLLVPVAFPSLEVSRRSALKQPEALRMDQLITGVLGFKIGGPEGDLIPHRVYLHTLL